MKISWKWLIIDEMKDKEDSLENVESSTINQSDWDKDIFKPPFTIWTKTRVYFPIGYDGRERCGSVSRNSDGVKTNHVGGGC